MQVKIIEALADNYMYLLIDEKTNQAAVFDPVEPDKILAAVEEADVKIAAIFTTHHHWDHAGGNLKLLEKVGKIPVYGGDKRIDGLTHNVKHEEEVTMGSLKIKCLHTPCHTTGHVCFHVKENEKDFVFTGDTLFFAGCGKFFEGTPEQMFTALIETLGTLPDNTLVYCGHEYTVNNLKYALSVEPENLDIREKLDWAMDKRKKGEATVPSTIGDEKRYNPFMRVQEKTVQVHAREIDPVAVMKFLRLDKNNFKG